LQPTTANPDYRKLIWVSNMLNSHNDVTIQVRAFFFFARHIVIV
jgi:hypothetical protein